MLFIEEFNKKLNQGERKYTDEEIKMIRDLLYQLSEFEKNEFKKCEDECNNLL